jgi:hypothetical protein
MCLSRQVAALLSAALLAGCATRSVPVDRKPDPSLLQPCTRPVPPPAKATDNDIALALVDAVQRYLECEARQKALADFVKGGK